MRTNNDAAKKACIAKFIEWWDNASSLRIIIDEINPQIFKMLNSINNTDTTPRDKHATSNMTNASNELGITNTNRLAEILYNIVGPHFLKNIDNDKEKRRKFLSLILKTAINDGHVRKKDILEVVRRYARKDERSNIKDVQDVPRLIMTKRLAREMAVQLDLPMQVAETEHQEKKEPIEVITPHSTLNPLYDYQYTTGRFIRKMLEGREDHNKKKTLRKLITIPTGAGKTRLVAETIIRWFNDGKESNSKQQRNSKFVLWVAQSGELCEQAFSTFKYVFQAIGKPGTALHLHRFWGPGGTLPDLEVDDILTDKEGIIIATINSLYKLLDYRELEDLANQTSCIIIDEAHHTTASSYSKVLRKMGFNWNNRKSEISEKGIVLIGLTATPFRGTGDGSDTETLKRWFNGVYLPNIPYKHGIENFKPHALIDCQTYVNAGEYVKILGERSYDRDGFIDDKDYFWRIIRWDGSKKIEVKDEWIFERQKNIELKPEKLGEYEITLKVIDNEGDYDTATARMYVYQKPTTKDEKLSKQQKNMYETLTKKDILCNVYHLVLKSSDFQVSKKEVNYIQKWGEFSDATLRSVEENIERNLMIVKEISSLRNIGLKKILFFGCSVNHSRMISILLKTKYGIKSDYVDSRVGIDARVRAIERFRNGDLEVLCNFGILTAGFDAPSIDCVFVGRPVRSTLLYTQMIGRGMRGVKTGGTERMLLVDVDDNFQLNKGHDLDIAKLGWRTFSSYWTYIKDRTQFPHTQKNTDSSVGMALENTNKPLDVSTSDPKDLQPLSHTCSKCKVNAVGIESIERIFGVMGDPKTLMDSLATKNHPGIPQECQECRGFGGIRIPKQPTSKFASKTKSTPPTTRQQRTKIKNKDNPTAEDIDNEFKHLSNIVYTHIPTSRQFWELASFEIRNAMKRSYGGYHEYLKAKGITVLNDQRLKDNLYDEYFEWYINTDKNQRTDKSISAKSLHKYGKYRIDDYVEGFGSLEEFESEVDPIIVHIDNIGKNASFEEVVSDYEEITTNCRREPHFEEVREMSKIGIEHYLSMFGSLSRFRQVKGLHRSL